jgi:ribonuclease BN (tRNA processing enzyme)
MRCSRMLIAFVALAIVVWTAFTEFATPVEALQARTQIVMLGTGSPNPTPDQSGPATAIVVDQQVYLVDAGPGIVRRVEAARLNGMEPFNAGNLNKVFLTHLHSDHTLGLPDLMFSPWVLGRMEAISVYGPPGTKRMTDHLEEAWSEDIYMRLFGLEPQPSTEGYKALTHEIEGSGLIYSDELVQVFAIPVNHGSWPVAYGYKFVTPDRVIVISGDAGPSPALFEACDGCDVLIHEVYSSVGLESRPLEWQRYHRSYHTSTVELAKLAQRSNPDLLVLYHQLLWGVPDNLAGEMKAEGYLGRVVSARDLDVF